MIKEMLVGFTVLLFLIGANVAWQRLHCGTPVCRTNPLQVIPCEQSAQVMAEIDYLERMARDRPAK